MSGDPVPAPAATVQMCLGSPPRMFPDRSPYEILAEDDFHHPVHGEVLLS